MSAAGAFSPEDFREAVASAVAVDPKAPLRRLALAAGEQSYAFSLHNDVIKLVTLTPRGDTLRVRVRFAADVVLQDDRHEIALPGAPTVEVDHFGLCLRWTAPLVSWLAWPQMTRSRRF